MKDIINGFREWNMKMNKAEKTIKMYNDYIVNFVDEYQITKIGDLIEGIDYSKYVAQLIKLCQIQQKEINELEARLEKLEQKENN